MKKNLLFLILCTVLCACSNNPDVSDVRGEYLITGSCTMYCHGEEFMKTIWYKDSIVMYYEDGTHSSNPITTDKQRQVFIEENDGVGYVRTTLFGEPDTTIDKISGSFSPMRISKSIENVQPTGSDSHELSLRNGIIIIYYKGENYFISKPIKILRNKADRVELEKPNPFNIGLTYITGEEYGQAKIQYKYGPIYKHGDQIEWNSEYSISIPEALQYQQNTNKCDIVKFHVEGTRVK